MPLNGATMIAARIAPNTKGTKDRKLRRKLSRVKPLVGRSRRSKTVALMVSTRRCRRPGRTRWRSKVSTKDRVSFEFGLYPNLWPAPDLQAEEALMKSGRSRRPVASTQRRPMMIRLFALSLVMTAAGARKESRFELGDLVNGQALIKAHCGGCGRATLHDPMALAQVGEDKIERRLHGQRTARSRGGRGSGCTNSKRTSCATFGATRSRSLISSPRRRIARSRTSSRTSTAASSCGGGEGLQEGAGRGCCAWTGHRRMVRPGLEGLGKRLR